MIILDTNVVSEVMRLAPDQTVVAWVDRQIESSIWITAVTVFEVRTGIEVLAPSRRRAGLSADFERLLTDFIQNRVVAFDAEAARAVVTLMADRQRTGRTRDVRDTMIAGIVTARGASLATRNTRDFNDLSVTLINPRTD